MNICRNQVIRSEHIKPFFRLLTMVIVITCELLNSNELKVKFMKSKTITSIKLAQVFVEHPRTTTSRNIPEHSRIFLECSGMYMSHTYNVTTQLFVPYICPILFYVLVNYFYSITYSPPFH